LLSTALRKSKLLKALIAITAETIADSPRRIAAREGVLGERDHQGVNFRSLADRARVDAETLCRRACELQRAWDGGPEKSRPSCEAERLWLGRTTPEGIERLRYTAAELRSAADVLSRA
jgi:hypothetical protein